MTDADVHFGRECLKKAVILAQNHKLDFLTVLPISHSQSWVLRIFLAHAAHILAVTFSAAKKKGFAGVGAFLFMNREVYRRSEGYEWLRMEVVDDAGLAYVMKRAGANMGIALGSGELEMEWYPNFPAFVRGLEKNIFSAFQYSVVFLALAFFANVASSGAY